MTDKDVDIDIDIASELKKGDVSVEELQMTIRSSLAQFIPFAVQSNEYCIRMLLAKRVKLGNKKNQERGVIKDAIDGVNTTITTLTKSLDTLIKLRKSETGEGDDGENGSEESSDGDNVVEGMDSTISGMLQDS